MSDYKESTVSGTSWTRVCRAVIENPHGGAPTLMFVEEEVTVIGDKTINQPCANLFVQMDAGNALHTEIYNKLNELYVVLREARDLAAESVPTDVI